MRLSRAATLAAVLLLAALPVPAAAAGTHPVHDIEDCFDLLDAGQAQKAATGFRRLFADWEGHPDIVRNLARIEEGLIRALHAGSAKPLTAKDVFGKHLVSFDSDSREVELSFPAGTQGSWWRSSRRAGYFLLDIEFRGALIVKYTREFGSDPRVLLFWDEERGIGYEASPARNRIQAHDGQGSTLIHEGESRNPGSEQGAFVNGDEVGTTLGRYLAGKCRHTGYRRGRAGLGGGTFSRVSVHGFLSPDWLNERAEKARAWAMKEWATEHFQRDREIPEWARKAAGSSPESFLGPPPERQEIALLLDFALSANETARQTLRRHGGRKDVEGGTAHCLSAALDLLEGRNASGYEHAKALVTMAPDWPDAHALLGIAGCRLRKKGEAADAIERAIELSPGNSLAWYGRAQIGLLDYDIEATLEAVNAAKDAGAASPWLDSAREQLGRAVAGPGWKKHETVTTSHFEILSPESKELCRTVAHTLESALRDYAKFFPSGAETKKRARVYVFRDRNEYLGWSRTSGRSMENSVGVYVHLLRELSFFRGKLTEQSFLQVVRHEGFHRFAGLFLDEVPIWMNEGCAEYFSHCREKFGGGIDPGEIDRDAVRLLTSRRGSLTPLRELFVMDPRAFMADAQLHYAQSWAVIYYMFETDPKRLRSVFRAYFTALQEGRTAEDAFKEHIEPVMGRIEANYLQFPR